MRKADNFFGGANEEYRRRWKFWRSGCRWVFSCLAPSSWQVSFSSVCNIFFIHSSVHSEGKNTSTGQRWDVRHGGRGLRPADQTEPAAAHLHHRLHHPRPHPHFCPPHPRKIMRQEVCNTWLNFKGVRKLEIQNRSWNLSLIFARNRKMYRKCRWTFSMKTFHNDHLCGKRV